MSHDDKESPGRASEPAAGSPTQPPTQRYPSQPYPWYPYLHYPPPFYYPPPPRRPTNALAVVSMVLAFSGIITCLVFVCPVALIMGYVARRHIAEQGQSGGEFATIGIICGWIGTAILLLIGALMLIPLILLVVASA